MQHLFRPALSMLAAIGIAMASSAPALAVVTPTWSNATTNSGSFGDFDTGTLSFGGVSGSSIVILNPANGYYHDHDNGCSATLSLHLNGTWTLVYTHPVSNDNDQLLSTFPKVTFLAGSVDGVRLGSTCAVGDAYHSIDSAMRFDIAGGSAIPTLSEVGLLALASLMLAAGGLVLRRSQRR
jgi:hypothetical protein